jgi:hypothetical protein
MHNQYFTGDGKEVERQDGVIHKHGEGAVAVLTVCLNGGLGGGERQATVSKQRRRSSLGTRRLGAQRNQSRGGSVGGKSRARSRPLFIGPRRWEAAGRGKGGSW